MFTKYTSATPSIKGMQKEAPTLAKRRLSNKRNYFLNFIFLLGAKPLFTTFSLAYHFRNDVLTLNLGNLVDAMPHTRSLPLYSIDSMNGRVYHS